jgi:hypothetical protein
VLSFVAEHPDCCNSQLAELVSMSVMRVEALVSRLIRRGYLHSYGRGRARRLELKFRVEHDISPGRGSDGNRRSFGGVSSVRLTSCQWPVRPIRQARGEADAGWRCAVARHERRWAS